MKPSILAKNARAPGGPRPFENKVQGPAARVINELDEAMARVYIASVHHGAPGKMQGDWASDLRNATSLKTLATRDPSMNGAEKQAAQTIRQTILFIQQHQMIE